jgi:hypothetical protein
MPEPDPLTDALAKFTPVAGFDRDALLFEAGRRSARPSWLLHVGAGLLVVSNAILLVVPWLREREAAPAPVPVETRPPAMDPPRSVPPDGLTAGSPPGVLTSPPRPVDGEFISTGPPLTVRSTIPIE